MKLGVYNFDGEEWEEISDEAKIFIRKLLEYDPSKRLTAAETLKDPWMIKYKSYSEKDIHKFTKNL